MRNDGVIVETAQRRSAWINGSKTGLLRFLVLKFSGQRPKSNLTMLRKPTPSQDHHNDLLMDSMGLAGVEVGGNAQFVGTE
jgi:hypothetical protein